MDDEVLDRGIYKDIQQNFCSYASKIRILKEKLRQKLIIFKNKSSRKIFGPNCDSDNNLKTNTEIKNLFKNKNVANVIRSRRIYWLDHITKSYNKQKPI